MRFILKSNRTGLYLAMATGSTEALTHRHGWTNWRDRAQVFSSVEQVPFTFRGSGRNKSVTTAFKRKYTLVLLNQQQED